MSNRLTLRFVNIAHFIDHYFLLIFPTAVLVIHREWGMSYAQALALGTPGFIVFAAATYPAGWLGDRWGRLAMMRLFFLGLGAAALATALARGPLTLSLGLAAIGLFAAIYHPVATALVVQLAKAPGRQLGINGVWGNLGVALAAALTAWLATRFGWRAAFAVPGALCVLCGIIVCWSSSRATPLADSGAAVRRFPIGFDRAEQRRVFAVVAVSALLGGLVFNGVIVAMPKLFEERLAWHGSGLMGVGAVTTAVFLAASFTQLFTGRLIDRLGPRPVLIIATGLQVPLLLLVARLPGLAVVPTAVPLMLLVFGVIPVSAWLLGHYVDDRWRARAYGVQFLLSMGMNAMVLPLVSFLHHRTGASAALFVVLAAAEACVFAASLLLPGRRRTAPAAIPQPAVAAA